MEAEEGGEEEAEDEEDEDDDDDDVEDLSDPSTGHCRRRIMVQISMIMRHRIILFPTSEEVSKGNERANE